MTDPDTSPTLADTLRALADMAKAREYDQLAIYRIADHAHEIAETLERVTAKNAALRAEVERLRDRLDGGAGTLDSGLGRTGAGDASPRMRVRFVATPRASPTPGAAWVAYSPERPDLGSFYAGSEAEAMAKIEAAYRAKPTRD